ncbi:MAG TPA: hypothetical protein VGT05_04900 [Patescibacteria group bacterium]|nr:hypothetical protein [Patescibacteria group bacterium]
MNIFDSYKLDTEIIPGILEEEWSEIERKIGLIKPFAHIMHIDLLDGIFAGNKTFSDPSPFALYAQDIFFELHLMVEDPLASVEKWANVGFKRFVGQVEKMPDIAEFVARVEDIGEVGLAIDTQTPVKTIQHYLEDIDVVLVMTVKAGFSHQTFEQMQLAKVQALRRLDPLLPIEIDGGITPQTLPLAKRAGATRFVSTGFLFGGQSCQAQYDLLKEASAQVSV